MKTPEEIAKATQAEFGWPINPSPDTITDMIHAGVEADRAQRDESLIVRSDEGASPVRTGAFTLADAARIFNEMVEDGYDPEGIYLEGIEAR